MVVAWQSSHILAERGKPSPILVCKGKFISHYKFDSPFNNSVSTSPVAHVSHKLKDTTMISSYKATRERLRFHAECIIPMPLHPHLLVRSWAWRARVLERSLSFLSPVLSIPQTLAFLSVAQTARSGTLYLTCPSAPRGFPLMKHYGEQMHRGQPGQKQPATVI